VMKVFRNLINGLGIQFESDILEGLCALSEYEVKLRLSFENLFSHQNNGCDLSNEELNKRIETIVETLKSVNKLLIVF
ncbi:hypothetical protein THOM_1975, partial [Trachipleistophora hominis]